MPNASRSLKQLFLDALAVAPAERAAWLARECADDSALRQQLELMLAAHDAPQSLLDRIAPAATFPGPEITENVCETIPTGTTIGPYKLLQQIGEGGFGVVFMAEQTQPVRRKVALKVLKPGMDTRQVVARFEAERQALAIMDHPHIAKVFDAGSTSEVRSQRPEVRPVAGGSAPTSDLCPLTSGRPYFVMELVPGTPITQYCDENSLSVRERLALFGTVCQAIQHAHTKGIIHRDIKPSNVLVTRQDGQPVVKVIDFGIAKAMGQQLTDKTVFTNFAQMIGTPLYMSPEQAELSTTDIDTRSDIYSLGVLLYELLTGSTPVSKQQLKQAAFDEIRRIIREDEAPRPSHRISTAEAAPSIAAQRHTEPAKLARLVRGELDWIVMKALEKDRNRRYETASGFAADIQHYLNDEAVVACPPSAAYRFRKFARRNKGRLVAAIILTAAVLIAVSGVGWAVRDRLARDADSARERSQRQKRLTAQVNEILANVDRLEREQKWPEAMSAAQRAEVAVTGGEADAATADCVGKRLKDLDFIGRLEQIRMERASSLREKFDNAAADREYARAFREYGVDVDGLAVETAIERLKALTALAIPLAAALDEWATARRVSKGDAGDWRRLLAIASAIDPEPLRDRLRSMKGQPVAQTQAELRKLAESTNVRAHPPATLLTLERRLRGINDINSSLRLLRDAQQVYSEDFWINYQLAHRLGEQKDHEGAVRFYTAAASLRPDAVAAHNNLGNALQARGMLDEAIAAHCKALELDPEYAMGYSNLGIALNDQKKLDEAIVCYRKAIELDPNHPAVYINLGVALRAQGKVQDALAAYKNAIELDPNRASGHLNLGILLREDLNENDKAMECFRKAIELDPNYPATYISLGSAFRAQKKVEEALAAYKRAIELDPNSAHCHCQLGALLCDDLNENDKAIECFRKAIELDPKNVIAYKNLGIALCKQERLNEAVAATRKAIAIDPTIAKRCSYVIDRLAITGWELVTNSDPKARDLKRAVEIVQQAIEIDPESSIPWQYLGWVRYRIGDWRASIEALEKSCKLQDGGAGDCGQWIVLALAHARLAADDDLPENERNHHKTEAFRWFNQADKQIDRWGHDRPAEPFAQAIWDFRAEAEAYQVISDLELAALSEAIEKNSGNSKALDARAHWFLARGRFVEAEQDFERLLKLEPENHWHWYHRACLLAYLQNEMQYRLHCREMLQQFAGTSDGGALDRTTKSALLLPNGAGGDVEALAQRADHNVQLEPDSPWAALLKGMAEFRVGRNEQAIEWLEKCRAAPSEDHPARSIAATAYLAIARHKVGAKDEAKAELEGAIRKAIDLLPQVEKGGDLNQGGIENWLIAQAALREAKATILNQTFAPAE